MKKKRVKYGQYVLELDVNLLDDNDYFLVMLLNIKMSACDISYGIQPSQLRANSKHGHYHLFAPAHVPTTNTASASYSST